VVAARVVRDAQAGGGELAAAEGDLRVWRVRGRVWSVD
jgi:hypothetical protein